MPIEQCPAGKRALLIRIGHPGWATRRISPLQRLIFLRFNCKRCHQIVCQPLSSGEPKFDKRPKPSEGRPRWPPAFAALAAPPASALCTKNCKHSSDFEKVPPLKPPMKKLISDKPQTLAEAQRSINHSLLLVLGTLTCGSYQAGQLKLQDMFCFFVSNLLRLVGRMR